jgi:hypothetical protein
MVWMLNNKYGPMINGYTIPKIDLLREIVKKVLDFVKKTMKIMIDNG